MVKIFQYVIVSFSLILALSIVCMSFTANFAEASTSNQTNATASNTNTQIPLSSFTGYAIAKKHVYDAPLQDVHLYCSSGSGGIMASCLLFDGNTNNASLIGIEYIISSAQYASLPDREKPNWTPVAGEAESDLRFPNLTPQQIQDFFNSLKGTYTKLIITWDPKDNLPLYPPQVVVESLIEHNGTK